MDGKYLNNSKATSFIDKWIIAVNANTESWKANYFYINEIEVLRTSTREGWVRIAFDILNYIKNNNSKKNLIPFIHLPLKEDSEELPSLSLDDINENISLYSPPSLHFCSVEYYNNYYLKRLKEIKIISKELDNGNYYFFDKYFDSREEEYYFSVYIFSSII